MPLDQSRNGGAGIGHTAQEYIDGAEASGDWRPVKALVPSTLTDNFFYLQGHLADSPIKRPATATFEDFMQINESEQEHDPPRPTSATAAADAPTESPFTVKELVPIIVWKDYVLKTLSRYINTPSDEVLERHPQVSFYSKHFDCIIPHYVLRDLYLLIKHHVINLLKASSFLVMVSLVMHLVGTHTAFSIFS